MSGPKLTAWEIEENRRRAEEWRQALLTELEACRRAVRAELARARAHAAAGVDLAAAAPVDVVVDEHDPMSIEAAIRQIQCHADQLRRQTNGAVVARDRRAGLANLAAGVPYGEAISATGVNREAAARSIAHVFDEQFNTALDAILTSLDADAGDALSDLMRFVELSGTGSQVDERVLLGQVEDRVAILNRRELRRRERVAHARELLLDLIGVAGEDAAELRRRLNAVFTNAAELPEHADQLVHDVLERQHQSEDRVYVVDMLRESLVQLGYAVGSSFSTEMLRDGATLVDRAGWSAHAVEVRMTPTNSMVMSVVREGDPMSTPSESDRRRDAEVEVEFCSTVGPVLDDLGTRGVSTGPVRSHAAGANPVRVVAPRTAQRRSAAQAPRAEEIRE